MATGPSEGILPLPGERLEGESSPDNFEAAFEAHFPGDKPRKHQKKAVREILTAFLDDDVDVIELDAPPGFGKSVTIYTALRMMPGNSYYATPLKSLQEQLVTDDMMGSDILDIMGRQNYDCILPEAERGTTVDEAKCQREEDFDCDIKHKCPYYAQKRSVRDAKIAVMNLAYMMSVPITLVPDDGQFAPRDVMVIDECQGTDDWATQFVTVTISDMAMPKPVREMVEWPAEDDRDDYERMGMWLMEEVLPTARQVAERVGQQSMVDKDELDMLDRIESFVQKAERFIDDQKDHQWTLTYDMQINKNMPNNRRAVFEPVKPGRFMGRLLWDKTDKILLSSATLPKGDWRDEIGIGDKDVRRLNIPSEFPVENRPVVTDEAVGKMTYNKRDDNIVDMAKKIKEIAGHHEGEKGIVHCRAYNYINMFKQACKRIDSDSGTESESSMLKWYNDNVHIQDRENREESLEEWINNDKQVFLSVNMAEGIDLEGDRCRWQALMKALYPNMGNERVSYRVNEMNDWDWYNNKAAVQIEQAYGRAVRSPDDSAVFYVLDESAVGLIERRDDIFHDWFLEGLQ